MTEQLCEQCQQVNCQCRAVLLKENRTEQPTSECKCIDCNLPELESSKLPEPVKTGFLGLNAHIIKPEQPNTELLIVKTIQGLMSAASRELTELNKITSIAKHKVLIDEVLEDIDSTERNSLFELQKAFE